MILERRGFELHRSVYTLSKCALRYFMICGWSDPLCCESTDVGPQIQKVSCKVIFRFLTKRLWVPLISCDFKGSAVAEIICNTVSCCHLGYFFVCSEGFPFFLPLSFLGKINW